jgi:hypothetical protein
MDYKRMAIKRSIPPEEVAENYPDFDRLMAIWDHEVVEDEHGTWRWRPNEVIRWATWGDPAPVSMNDLWAEHGRGSFTTEEVMAFYRDSGYSLSGFIEIFCGHGDKIEEFLQEHDVDRASPGVTA